MKNILLIILIFVSGYAMAQVPPGYIKVPERRYSLNLATDGLTVPSGTTPALSSGQWVKAGALYVDTTGGNKGLFYYIDGVWIRLYDTLDAVGSTLTPLGSGYKVLYGTSGIKSITATNGLTPDSATSGEVGLKWGGTLTGATSIALGTNTLDWTLGGAMGSNTTPFEFTQTPTSFSGTTFFGIRSTLSGTVTGSGKKVYNMDLATTANRAGSGGQNITLRLSATGAPSGSNYAMIVDSGYVGIGEDLPGANLWIRKNNMHESWDFTSGIVMGNDSAATAAYDQTSPGITFAGLAWDSVGLVSRGLLFSIYNLPSKSSSSGTVPNGILKFIATPSGSGTAVDLFGLGAQGQFYLGGTDAGTANQVLISNGPSAAPSWVDQSSIGSGNFWKTSGGTTILTDIDIGGGLNDMFMENFTTINISSTGAGEGLKISPALTELGDWSAAGNATLVSVDDATSSISLNATNFSLTTPASSIDTTTYKPLAIDPSNGAVRRMNSWAQVSGGSASVTWNGITDPTGDQALTFGAGESSTWTDQNTTEDLFTVNNATSTTHSMFSLNRTSTALAAGNNMMEIISSGANGTNGIDATGLRISVTNTNATSGTNIGLDVTASGATTANVIGRFTGGIVQFRSDLTTVLTIQNAAASQTAGTIGRASSSGLLIQAALSDLQLSSGGSAATGVLISSVHSSASTVIYSGGSSGTAERIRSSVGSVVINDASADVDFRVESDGDANALVVDGGLNFAGVGTASPNSKLHVNGSFATAYVAKTGTYTATESDYTIECTSGTFTVTLPTAVGCAGRMYFVTNSGAGTITLGTTSSQTFANVAATPTTLTLGTLTGALVQSNGANWLKIASF